METAVGVVEEEEVAAPSPAGTTSAVLDPAALPVFFSATTNSAPRFLSARGCHEPELDISYEYPIVRRKVGSHHARARIVIRREKEVLHFAGFKGRCE